MPRQGATDFIPPQSAASILAPERSQAAGTIVKKRTGLRSRQTLGLTMAFMLVCAQAMAQSPAPDGASHAHRKPPKTSSHQRDAATPVSEGAAASSLPCPRAQWKDDPVCFGENDRDSLPVPDARGRQERAEHHSGDVSIEPKMGVNRPAQPPVYINNPNPNPLGTQFGAGVDMKLPF